MLLFQAEGWISDKLKVAYEDDFKNVGDLIDKMKKLQKHQAFEAEIIANTDRINQVKEVMNRGMHCLKQKPVIVSRHSACTCRGDLTVWNYNILGCQIYWVMSWWIAVPGFDVNVRGAEKKKRMVNLEQWKEWVGPLSVRPTLVGTVWVVTLRRQKDRWIAQEAGLSAEIHL